MAGKHVLTLEERRILCRCIVTLDGKKAQICGAKNQFATVRALPDGPEAEFAWPTVVRIVAQGGHFKS